MIDKSNEFYFQIAHESLAIYCWVAVNG